MLVRYARHTEALYFARFRLAPTAVSLFERALMVRRIHHLVFELDFCVIFLGNGLHKLVKTHLWVFSALVAGSAAVESTMRVVAVSALNHLFAEVARVGRSARRTICFGCGWIDRFKWMAFVAVLSLLVCSNSFEAFPTAPVLAAILSVFASVVLVSRVDGVGADRAPLFWSIVTGNAGSQTVTLVASDAFLDDFLWFGAALADAFTGFWFF